MKIATIIVRVLLGLLFTFSALAYFFQWVQPPEMEGPIVAFNEGLAASRYLLPLVKSLELGCGVVFIIGRFVPLATLLILPISVNIFLVHVFLAPEGLPIALFVILANLFLVFACHRHYRGILAARIER